MRFVLIFIIAILIISCDDSKYVVNRTDDGALISEGFESTQGKENKWVYYDENQDTLYVRFFTHNQLEKEYVYSKGNIIRRVVYENDVVMEATSFDKNGEVINYSRSFPEMNKGVSFSFNKNFDIESFNFYKLKEEEEWFLPNQKLIGSFAQFHKNGNLYARSVDFNKGIFNVYDTTGILVYVVNYSTNDTLFKIENHKEYFIPSYN